jgi:hypothetical protein
MEGIKHLHGVYRAVVKDNRDPDNLRRLRLQVQTTGEEVTDWAWPIEMAGTNVGVPDIGQGVWVSYIGGDPEHPIWHGKFGRHQSNSKPVSIKPLKDSVPLTGLSSYLVINTLSDGTKEIDLVATLVATANKLKNHETRITSLESQIATLHSTLATRTSPSHTHGSNG